MVKKASRKSTAAELLDSPPPTEATATATPSPPSFDFKAFNRNSSGSLPSKKWKTTTATAIGSGLKSSLSPTGFKSLSSISDIKELASSEMESIKRTIDRSHTEIVKEFEASYSRLNKRSKMQMQMQMQTCQQLSDEAEKDYKKMSERISGTRDARKASYAECMAEAQASGSRVCKTSIPELSQSLKKAIDGLQNRYEISLA